MKNYWDDGELYSQPSESLLRRNASDSLKKQKMKGKAMHPILISGRKIARSLNRLKMNMKPFKRNMTELKKKWSG